MSLILQYVLNGLMQGTIYGLVALGFTLFFGVMDVINFSHGDVLTLGAFGALAAAASVHAAGFGPAAELAAVLLAATLAAAFAGALVARTLIMPLRHAPPLNMLLMTMMVGTVIREGLRLFYPNGSNPQRFPVLLPSGGVSLATTFVRTDGVILIAAGIACIALVYWIINRTRFGLAMRAVAEDEETARTSGIDVSRIIPLVFALGSATAGFGGAIDGLYYSEINYGMGVLLAIIGFSAAIIGGLGNVWGAILGGYLFAGLQTFAVAALPLPNDYKDVFAFGVVITLMTWRPTGLLAERSNERV